MTPKKKPVPPIVPANSPRYRAAQKRNNPLQQRLREQEQRGREIRNNLDMDFTKPDEEMASRRSREEIAVHEGLDQLRKPRRA